MLGYGINAYFDIMYSLVFMFATITIACIPIYYNYANNDARAIDNMDIPIFKKFTQQFTLGNLGGADTLCKTKELGLNLMQLNCQNARNGKINAKTITYGLLDN